MKKLNWGHKLVFFTLLFMVFIITMVYQISTQQVDLVDKNYYERGVKYEQDINKYNASQDVAHEVTVDGNAQLLQFKVSGEERFNGKLFLYRPGDASLDKQVFFALNKDGYYTYSTAPLKIGLWKATFEWTLNGKLMATEYPFVVR